MEVEYIDSDNNSLCFKHAVKAVIENDESISANVPDNINDCDCGGTGYLGSFCVVCSKDIQDIEDGRFKD